MSRKYTNHILELVDEGMLEPKELVRDLLGRMSEADVEDFFFEYGLDSAVALED